MNSPVFKLSRSILVIIAGLTPLNLVAAENSSLHTPGVDVSAFITMIFGLIAVLALIFIVAWLSRKMKFLRHLSSDYYIKNLASLSLSNREKICLIEVSGKQMLIGIAPGSVRNIYVFEESLTPENNKNKESEAADNRFSKHFKNALGLSAVRRES